MARTYSALLSIAILIAVTLYFTSYIAQPSAQRVAVTALPISFDPNATDRIKFGQLKWRGGLVLMSDNRRFGGISGLVIDKQGKNIVGVTDNSFWIKAELVYDGQKLSGVDNVHIAPLRGQNKRPFLLPNNQDAESIVALQDGSFLISFERNHRIVKFTSLDGRPDYQKAQIALPEDSRAMAYNGGIEALASIRGGKLKGRLLAFSESLLDSDQYIKGWILGGEKSDNIYLKAMGGFSVTEIASLDDGALLFLERRYTRQDGVSMRIRIIKSDDVKPDARLTGEILFEANSYFQIDNMEGLAVHKNSQGQSILTLISDDNFSKKQRTLILQFELSQNISNGD